MSLISEIAQGYQNIGTAKAQGQAASGQIWGQTLANLGQIPAQIQQIKHQQQADALQGMELEGKRREMAAQEALNNAMSTALKPDGSIDLDKISKSLAGTPAAYKFADVSAHVASMQQSHANLLKANQEVAKSEADQIGALAAAADVYDDPHDKAGVLLAGIASGIKGGSISPEHGKAVIASLLGPNGQPDPAAVNQKIAEMKALSKEQQELGLKRTDDARQATAALETARHDQATEAAATANQARQDALARERLALDRQREAREAWNAPLETIIGKDGKPVLVPRSQAVGRQPAPGSSGDKGPTQAEATVAGYANRVEDAETTLTELEKPIANMSWASFKFQGYAPPKGQSNTYQQYDQAGRNFINSVLRRESGAAISEGEFANARAQYLPQPGDTPETLELKRQNRATVHDSLVRAAGGAYTPRAPKAKADATAPKKNPFR